MSNLAIIFAGALSAAILAMPAFAQSVTSVPEPSNLALLALGVIGVVLGRQGSRKPPKG